MNDGSPGDRHNTALPSHGDRDSAVAPADADVSLARYWVLVGVVFALFLLTFVVVAALSVPLLDDPAPLLGRGGGPAALGGGALLVADVVLPVPASVVMIANGVLFGIAAGAALSLIGGTAAAVAGYGLGRWAGPAVLRRVCSPAEQQRAMRLVARWGVLAVVVTRPVPLLAETVAVMAGAQRMGWGRTAVAAVVGVLPAAVLYAAAGALGGSGQVGLGVFGVVVLVAALLWFGGWVRAGNGVGGGSR